MSAGNHVQISKFLSLVLRHQPEVLGITLDNNGWTDVEELLAKMQTSGKDINREMLDEIVATNPKKRFAFSPDGKRIRASQGHSIAVDLGLTLQKPPAVLFHGTGSQSVASILENGLQRRSRQHVHLSKDLETACIVGRRHGKANVFEIDAERMYQDGLPFYLSDNGVWLTEQVPPDNIRLLEGSD